MVTITQLTADLKDAMRSGEHMKRDTIRAIITMLKNEAITQKIDVTDLSDDTILTLLKRAKKQRDEAYAQFMDGERSELAEKEKREAEIIAAYLPQQMSDVELQNVVQDVITQTGKENFGAVMGQVMARTKGLADGARVKDIVEKYLK